MATITVYVWCPLCRHLVPKNPTHYEDTHFMETD